MTTPGSEPAATGLFDRLFEGWGDWGQLLTVARELRRIDGECLDVMLDARSRGPDPLSQDDAAKVRSLVRMLRSLDLDPNAIRLTQPETMRALETACVGCMERNRCDHELAEGTAARTYVDFCPNAPRLSALSVIKAATG